MDKSCHPRRWLFFLMVATGVFLSTMDSSMVNIALPSIMRSFAAPLVLVEWVVLIYLTTITTSLLVWGRISDSIGKGKVYLCGMFIFSLGSGFCYLAPTLPLLISFRCMQALGASMMMSTGPAIIRLVFPQENLGKALGAIGIATSIGLVSGPMVGGFLIHHFSWRAIFVITLPVNFVVFLVGWQLLAGKVPKVQSHKSVRFDWSGGIIWLFLVSFTVLATSFFADAGISVKCIGFILFVILVYVFLLVEIKSEDPLLPVSLLRMRYYGIAMATSAISFAVLFVILILMPFYLDYILKFEVDTIGYIMMAVPGTLFVVSPLSGWLYDRKGAKVLTTCGLFLCCFATILLCLLTSQSSALDVAWRLALLGTGQSIFLSPNTASVLSRIQRQYTGVTSGMLATSRNLGMLAGVAMAGMIFMSFYSHLSGGQDLKDFSLEQASIFMKSFRVTLIGAALISFVGGILSWQRDREELHDS